VFMARERQHFEGHMASQGFLDRLVNHPHATPADFAENPVLSEPVRDRAGSCVPSRKRGLRGLVAACFLRSPPGWGAQQRLFHHST
jgi:hypothetical protein